MSSSEILPNSPFDISQRGISIENLANFKGVDRQLLVRLNDYRLVIMDGTTIGGNAVVALENKANDFTGPLSCVNRTEPSIEEIPDTAILNKKDILKVISETGSVNVKVASSLEEVNEEKTLYFI